MEGNPENWRIIDSAGHSVEVYDPAEPPRFGLLYLHSYGQESLRSRPVFVAELARRGWACLAPQGGPSWWLDRICAEFDPEVTAEQHLRANIAPLFATRWSLPPRRVAVLGVSMGGQGALRLGFVDPGTFPVVASLSGAIDFHELLGEGTPLDAMFTSREEARHETALLQIQGRQVPPWMYFACDPEDAWCAGNERLAEKLTANGVPHTCDLTTRAGGHSYLYFDALAPAAFAFLAAGLEAESRRLV